MATNHATDGTYWTGRDRPNGYLEILRLNSADYSVVESIGLYTKRGSAVAAAAELAYRQGRQDAIAELRAKVHAALEDIGLGSAVVAVPDFEPGTDDADLPPRE